MSVIRGVLAQFEGPDGVRALVSAWIVSARTPQ